ncbi:hypothetical protein [Pontibacillus salipaludis]|uniref:hypothetical protein n=1 Tax=Pontibacillus salipaludis TaxID=1697394 RepID=UPI0031EC4A24
MSEVALQQRRRLLHSFFKSASSCLKLIYSVKRYREASATDLRDKLDCDYIKMLSAICKWFEIWEEKIECLMRITPLEYIQEWSHEPVVKDWQILYMGIYKELGENRTPPYSHSKILELFHVLNRINRWIDTWKSNNEKATIWINPAIRYIKANDT